MDLNAYIDIKIKLYPIEQSPLRLILEISRELVDDLLRQPVDMAVLIVLALRIDHVSPGSRSEIRNLPPATIYISERSQRGPRSLYFVISLRIN